jgi:sterol desaturase/sphingolipid hydroxylase (fatty acid hydroxylase superfamily)
MKGQAIGRLFDVALGCVLKMSRTPANYWGEFVLDIPVGILFIFEGLRYHTIHPISVFFTILIGLFLFSFLEYFFHRWLFHGSVRIMVQGHRAHHENPLGYDALPFFLPALLLMGLLGVFVLMIPASYAFLLAGAIALGYVTYGLSHFTIHHTRFRRRMARRWAANHHIHHYHPDTNFGVTTPLWDIVLTTRYVRQYKRI